MFVSDILYANKDDSEAEVSVSDGIYTLNCYFYPCKSAAIYQDIEYIFGNNCSDIFRVQKKEYAVQKLSDGFAYQLTAKVIDNALRTVCIGEMMIELDSPIPKDIVNEEFITFYVSRLDCG